MRCSILRCGLLVCATLLGCDVTNTNTVGCLALDCQATCRADGAPKGADAANPFGKCQAALCTCNAAADAGAYEWAEKVVTDSDTSTGTQVTDSGDSGDLGDPGDSGDSGDPDNLDDPGEATDTGEDFDNSADSTDLLTDSAT